jgi:hypothetical protein
LWRFIIFYKSCIFGVGTKNEPIRPYQLYVQKNVKKGLVDDDFVMYVESCEGESYVQNEMKTSVFSSCNNRKLLIKSIGQHLLIQNARGRRAQN